MNKIYTNAPAPLDLSSVNIYKIILSRSVLEDAGSFPFSTGTLSGTSTIAGSIVPDSTISNQTNGKKLIVSLYSSNLGAGPNTITLNGTTFAGPTTESFLFTVEDDQISSNYWLTISSIDISITTADSTLSGGALEIREAFSLTSEENSGTCAELDRWDNGALSLIIKGTSSDFDIGEGAYIIDYPSSINIPYKTYSDLFIGGSFDGDYFAESTIEAPQFFNIMMSDVRVGESTSDALNFTSISRSTLHPNSNIDHTLLLKLDNEIKVINNDYTSFYDNFITSHDSVNSNFGESLIIEDSFYIKNASEVLSQKSGSIEFWISPIHDTWESDGKDRFIFDISNISTLEIESIAKDRIVLPERIGILLKAYVKSDADKVNILSENSLQKDQKTIFLNKSLPKQRTTVIVEYQPLSSEGDRLQLYLDGYTQLNFNVISSGKTLTISRNIDWSRNTWHRILCTWSLGNFNGLDRIRMFVDGTESNTITWGNITWGDGSIWGQSDANNTAIYGKLEPFEPLSVCSFGSDATGHFKYPFRLDNLRFSSIARQPITIGSSEYDLAYNANTDFCHPVVEDAYTNYLVDFNKNTEINTKSANLLKRDAPLYSIGVQIDDGFSKLENERVKTALLNIYQKLKPAHMQLYSSIVQDDE